jgi:uncharacterized protein (DUF2147 family)
MSHIAATPDNEWIADRSTHRHRLVVATSVALSIALASFEVSAAEVKDMLGKWRWKEFTIEVAECQSGNICAKVVDGPKNIGMQLFASSLVVKDGSLFGQITHPETKEVYNTRFQQNGPDNWHLDGCTAARVCLSGEFERVKQ